MKTVEIRGKQYIEVNERVKYFREEYPKWTIQTDIVKMEGDLVITKTVILDEESRVISTGLAYEKDGSSFINKTSYIENCETSSVGRALGFLGIGIDTSIASSQEVQNAIMNQNNQPSQPQVRTQAPQQRVAQQQPVTRSIPQQPQPESNTKQEQCPQCGGRLYHNSGISQKTGKSWSNTKCGNCDFIEWNN